MKKAKKTKVKSTKSVETRPIKDLLASLNALGAIDGLLRQAQFSVGVHNRVQAALGFISVLHRTVLNEALNHPEADSVPEFKELLKEKKND